MNHSSTQDSDAVNWPYKMKDLCALTGLGRQAIHFYIQQGLVPPGQKTGHNMAYYSDEHLERIQLIRKLQHEQFLPLKAIKAVLDEQESRYSPVQRDFLRSVRSSLDTDVPNRRESEESTVSIREVIEQNLINQADLTRLIELDVIRVLETAEGTLSLSSRDVRLVELAGQLRKVGFTERLGFELDTILKYEEVITELVNWEGQLVVSRLGTLPPDEAARTIALALPLIQQILGHFHEAKIGELLESI